MSEQETRAPIPSPEFDGGSFTIDFLSDSREGFDLKTDKSLPRRQGKYGLRDNPPGGLTPLPLTYDQHKKMENAMRGEVSYVNKMVDAKIKKDDLGDLSREQRQPIYMDRFHSTQKVGLRSVRQDGNTLVFDTVNVPFQFHLGINSPDDSPESLEMADPTVTSLVIETADKKMIVQHRSSRNSLYKNTWGASAAGHFDRPEGESIPGTLPPIGAEEVRNNAVKLEMNQEIGLDADDIQDLRIAGFGTNRQAGHHEFYLFAKSNLTGAQVQEKSEANAREKANDLFDFNEKFFVINADSESLKKLLTEFAYPTPHAGVFTAAYYSQLLETLSPAEAKAKLKELEAGIRANQKRIDQAVTEFDGSKRFDPAKTPEEQGFPPIEEALKSAGLLAN